MRKFLNDFNLRNMRDEFLNFKFNINNNNLEYIIYVSLDNIIKTIYFRHKGKKNFIGYYLHFSI